VISVFRIVYLCAADKHMVTIFEWSPKRGKYRYSIHIQYSTVSKENIVFNFYRLFTLIASFVDVLACKLMR